MELEKPINLVFEPIAHSYTNGDTGEVFTSATTLIGEYEKKFNTRYWAMFTALKNAHIPVRMDKNELYITVQFIKTHINTLYENKLYERLAENVKATWKAKTDKANKRGNKIHDYLEDTINESRGDVQAKDNSLITPLSIKGETSTELVIFRTKHDLDKTDLQETYPIIYKRLLMYIEGGCTLIAEKRIYTSKYMVAGMIDVLVVRGKYFWIVDWKSNKDEMKFTSGYYKKILVDGEWTRSDIWMPTDDKMSVPIQGLAKCKGVKYSLQLSLYSFMMELWGYTPAKNHLEIFHIRPRRKPLLIKVKYYRQEIISLLEHNLERTGIQNINDKPKRGFGII